MTLCTNAGSKALHVSLYCAKSCQRPPSPTLVATTAWIGACHRRLTPSRRLRFSLECRIRHATMLSPKRAEIHGVSPMQGCGQPPPRLALAPSRDVAAKPPPLRGKACTCAPPISAAVSRRQPSALRAQRSWPRSSSTELKPGARARRHRADDEALCDGRTASEVGSAGPAIDPHRANSASS